MPVQGLLGDTMSNAEDAPDALHDFPEDFRECIRFHRHTCPGLAIGYAAAKIGAEALGAAPSQDEELVAVVENDSCAVDAVQVLLGCTFGKGNLVFRDWGKQVFTFVDRTNLKAVRVSFVGEVPFRRERRELRDSMRVRGATPDDELQLERLKHRAIAEIISDPGRFFTVREIPCELPPRTTVVKTSTCSVCAEEVVVQKLVERAGRKICKECEMRAGLARQ